MSDGPTAPMIRVDERDDGSWDARVHDATDEFCLAVVRACLAELPTYEMTLRVQARLYEDNANSQERIAQKATDPKLVRNARETAEEHREVAEQIRELLPDEEESHDG